MGVLSDAHFIVSQCCFCEPELQPLICTNSRATCYFTQGVPGLPCGFPAERGVRRGQVSDAAAPAGDEICMYVCMCVCVHSCMCMYAMELRSKMRGKSEI